MSKSPNSGLYSSVRVTSPFKTKIAPQNDIGCIEAMGTEVANVLVVDDDVRVRRNIEKMLAGAGYSVTTTDNAEKGLEVFRENNFDILILDIMMPDWTGELSRRSGVDALSEIRKVNNTIPVIMLTGSTTVELAVESMKLGADDYVLKGNIGSQEFVEKVNTLIVNRRQSNTGIRSVDSEMNTEMIEMKSVQKWLLARSYGILDELVAGILLTGILYILGALSGIIDWSPLDWLSASGAMTYVGIGLLVVIVLVIVYFFLQRHQRHK